MANNLILFDNEFNLRNNVILNYIYSNLESVKKSDIETFIYCFTELYRLPLLVPLLDAIVTKLKHKQACFKLIPKNNWDRLNGHCTTVTKQEELQESIFKSRLFSKHYTIVIKKIIPDIIIHEIGHAVEHIAGIDIGDSFRVSLLEDLQLNCTHSVQVSAAIKSVMYTELEKYALKNKMAELFARFFELLGMSNEAGGWGRFQFHYDEILNYFINTVDWTNRVLIPILKKKTDSDVIDASAIFVENLKPFKNEWTKKHKHKFADVSDLNHKCRETTVNNEAFANDVLDTFKDKELKTLDNGVEYFEF
ncbi:MAG: hypothetical protein LBS34_00740 [Rickettsiales bacterium]|jgi:hypothetical protein|nr:hypothetical protein [Rickettsiales bacterium]